MKTWFVVTGLLVAFFLYVSCSNSLSNTENEGSNPSSESQKESTSEEILSSTDGSTLAENHPAPDNPAATGVCFVRDVLPIFISNCTQSGCHNASSRAEGIDLSSYAAILASAGGRGVIPSNPSSSKVYRSVTGTGGDFMPPSPNKALTAEQIALLKKWIEEGAKNTTCDEPNTCNTQNVTYSQTLQPIFQKNCVGCHNQSTASGGKSLDTYAAAKSVAAGGKLYLSVSRQAGATPMPPGDLKLSDCEIQQIKAWIDNGTPQ